MPWVTPPGTPADGILLASGRIISEAVYKRAQSIYLTQEQRADLAAARSEWGGLARDWAAKFAQAAS